MEDASVGWIAAMIIGGIAGWLAEQFMKSDMGMLMNIVLGIVGGLRYRDAAHFLDAHQAHGAIAARARHDDAHGTLPVDLGQGAKEDVDRQVRPPLSSSVSGGVQVDVVHREVHAWWDDVDVVRLHRHRFVHLRHVHHRRGALQDFRRAAFVLGREVKNEHEGHARMGRYILEEAQQGLQPARRRADADNREIQRAWREL